MHCMIKEVRWKIICIALLVILILSNIYYIRRMIKAENELKLDDETDFYGVWRIDKAALQSKMYTGTAWDGDFEENLYDPADYIGLEIEYNPEYFQLGSERYINPKYTLTNTTLKDVNEGGKFYNPDIYEFIINEKIEITNESDYNYLAEVPLLQVEVKFDREVSYDQFGFIPVGTQCFILNEDTMLIGSWGKTLLAYKISEE